MSDKKYRVRKGYRVRLFNGEYLEGGDEVTPAVLAKNKNLIERFGHMVEIIPEAKINAKPIPEVAKPNVEPTGNGQDKSKFPQGK